MGWTKTSISITDDAISTRVGLSKKSVLIDEIVSIYAEKVDKVTFDELFLVLEDSGGNGLTVGELDQGFAELEPTLAVRLNGFPGDWRQKLELADAGRRDKVWQRNAR